MTERTGGARGILGWRISASKLQAAAADEEKLPSPAVKWSAVESTVDGDPSTVHR
ncbi:MAG: hypothetical protein ABIQ97_00335 [Lysobacteraceae bacterium]